MGHKSSKSPSKVKSHKKEHKEGVEEPMTIDHQGTVESQVSSQEQTPKKMEQRDLEPLTPLIINDVSVTNHIPQATSTPAANGVISTGMQPASPPLSPGSTTDQSDDEAFTPTDQQLSFRSHSPTSSFASVSTTSSLRRQLQNLEPNKRTSEPNFGRFYTTSYLDGAKSNYLQRSSVQEKERQKSPHFHRPVNFSYAKDPPDFLKKKSSGMSALATGKRVVKVRRSSSPADLRNEEPVRMSVFPSAKPKEPNEPDKIERDDWPGLASPAAILPEILRQRRRSRGEKDEDEEEEESMKEDPKIQRELEEISKIKDESGMGKVIYQELEELKCKPVKPMDPWKASRVPSAKYEPRYHTRFQSPMFASPSRFIDRSRRSWDDSDIRGYRSAATLANLPIPKPGYGLSYTSPRAATLPVAGMYGARDYTYFGFSDGSHREDSEGHQRSNYTSSSTLTGDSGSRREGRSGVSSVAAYDVPSIPLLKLQKSTWHTEAEPPVYPYERLKITKFDLPRDADRNKLEIHLNSDEFQRLFGMPRERFYRLAEWKRNDMKKKLDLY
ncbi:hypothetical protein C0Q70_09504 [Pomacea canaliculata]|uniref:HP domain-containing protein n=1 Tax=Pomacea canaliculata TaxID=400727 RepID=A0A2T7PA00_POMCA|nr:dematin-like isoform X3 [Pomacea canaliculata]PVD30242.1 hypothetical protein C0Q70_09504 [Pomacea canaliculata]